MTGDPYAARRLISQTEVVPPFDGACSEIHRSSSGCTPKVRRDLAYFGQPHLENPVRTADGPRFGRAAKTLLRQAYPIRGEAPPRINRWCRSFVMMTPRHDSAEARPRTSQAEAGRMKAKVLVNV